MIKTSLNNLNIKILRVFLGLFINFKCVSLAEASHDIPNMVRPEIIDKYFLNIRIRFKKYKEISQIM